MKSIWNGKSKKLLNFGLTVAMLVLGAGCEDSPPRPGEGFYSYQGFRDWWRVPLVFPYQITMIDSLDSGTLEEFDATSLIAQPHCKTLVSDITHIGFDEKFSVFQQKNKEMPYGILIYASGEIKNFMSEEELAAFIRQNYPDIALPVWMELEKFYDWRWKTIDAIQKKDPQKLYYPEADSAPKRPREGFFSYQGYYHWWRIPLRFPYQVKITDSFDDGGALEKFDPQTLIVASQRNILAKAVTEIGFGRYFVIFKQKTNPSYHILIYASGEILSYASQEELAEFVKRNFPNAAVPELSGLEAFYHEMWAAVEFLQKNDPQKLAY